MHTDQYGTKINQLETPVKKAMRYLFIYLCLFISSAAMAQAGWNWPADGALKTQAIEKQAFYKVLMAQSKFDEAIQPLNWLYDNNPNLNQSIYIDGVKCLADLVKKADDADRKSQLQDSILWMFDMRIEHFDNDAATIDRKAFEAFKMYYNKPDKYPILADLFEKAYELNGPEISYFNMNPYMMLASRFYKIDPAEMPAEKVLDIHTQISEIIESQKKNGGNLERLDKEQAKVDGFLGSVGDILSCEFIEEKLVPKFRENSTDVSTAKKIFKYSLSAKCTDQPYFMEASETVFKSQPTYQLAKVLASKYAGSEDYEKALQYHDQSISLASSEEDKADALLGKAVISSKLGRKAAARKYAYESLSAEPGNPDSFNLIGNLYFTSYKECQGGESKVLDRGVFLAAYKMYEKAGNKSQMAACKEQFPSIEEMFNEGYEEGQSITVGCWINETVALARR